MYQQISCGRPLYIPLQVDKSILSRSYYQHSTILFPHAVRHDYDHFIIKIIKISLVVCCLENFVPNTTTQRFKLPRQAPTVFASNRPTKIFLETRILYVLIKLHVRYCKLHCYFTVSQTQNL